MFFISTGIHDGEPKIPISNYSQWGHVGSWRKASSTGGSHEPCQLLTKRTFKGTNIAWLLQAT